MQVGQLKVNPLPGNCNSSDRLLLKTISIPFNTAASIVFVNASSQYFEVQWLCRFDRAYSQSFANSKADFSTIRLAFFLFLLAGVQTISAGLKINPFAQVGKYKNYLTQSAGYIWLSMIRMYLCGLMTYCRNDEYRSGMTIYQLTPGFAGAVAGTTSGGQFRLQLGCFGISSLQTSQELAEQQF